MSGVFYDSDEEARALAEARKTPRTTNTNTDYSPQSSSSASDLAKASATTIAKVNDSEWEPWDAPVSTLPTPTALGNANSATTVSSVFRALKMIVIGNDEVDQSQQERIPLQYETGTSSNNTMAVVDVNKEEMNNEVEEELDEAMQDATDEGVEADLFNAPPEVEARLPSSSLIGARGNENYNRNPGRRSLTPKDRQRLAVKLAYTREHPGFEYDPRYKNAKDKQRHELSKHGGQSLRTRAVASNFPRRVDGLTLLNAHGEKLFRDARDKLEPFANHHSLALLMRAGVSKQSLMAASSQLVNAMRCGHAMNNGIYHYAPEKRGRADKRTQLVASALTSLSRVYPHALIGELESDRKAALAAELNMLNGTDREQRKAARAAVEAALRDRFVQPEQRATLEKLAANKAAAASRTVERETKLQQAPAKSSNPALQTQVDATGDAAEVDVSPGGLMPPVAREDVIVASLGNGPRVTIEQVEQDEDDLADEQGNRDPITGGEVKASLNNFRGEMAVLMEARANLFVRYVVGFYRGLRYMVLEAQRDAEQLIEHMLQVFERDGLFASAANGGLTRDTAKFALERHNTESYERAQQALLGRGIRVKIAFEELRNFYPLGREGQLIDGASSVISDAEHSNIKAVEAESLAELVDVFGKLMRSRDVAEAWFVNLVADEDALVAELAASGESQEFHAKRVAYVYTSYRVGLLIDASTYSFIVRRFDAFDEGLYRRFDPDECTEPDDECCPPYKERPIVVVCDPPPPCCAPPPEEVYECVDVVEEPCSVVVEEPCFHPCELEPDFDDEPVPCPVAVPCAVVDSSDCAPLFEDADEVDDCEWGSWFDWACSSVDSNKCNKSLCIQARANGGQLMRVGMLFGQRRLRPTSLAQQQALIGCRDEQCATIAEALLAFLAEKQAAVKNDCAHTPMRTEQEQVLAGYAFGQHVIAQLKTTASDIEQLAHFSIVLTRMLCRLFFAVYCERSCALAHDAHQLALDIGSFLRPLSKRPFVRGMRLAPVQNEGAPAVETKLLAYLNVVLETGKVGDKVTRARRDASGFVPSKMSFCLARPLFNTLRGAIDAVAQNLFQPASSLTQVDSFSRNLIASDWDRLFYRVEARLGKDFVNPLFVLMPGEPSESDIYATPVELQQPVVAPVVNNAASPPPSSPPLADVETEQENPDNIISSTTEMPPPRNSVLLPTRTEPELVDADRVLEEEEEEEEGPPPTPPLPEGEAAPPATPPLPEQVPPAQQNNFEDIEASAPTRSFFNAGNVEDFDDDETLKSSIGRRRAPAPVAVVAATIKANVPKTMKAGASLGELEREARIRLILMENNIK